MCGTLSTTSRIIGITGSVCGRPFFECAAGIVKLLMSGANQDQHRSPISCRRQPVRISILTTALCSDPSSHARHTRPSSSSDSTRSRDPFVSGLFVPMTGFVSAKPSPIAHTKNADNAARAAPAVAAPLLFLIAVMHAATSRRVMVSIGMLWRDLKLDLEVLLDLLGRFALEDPVR